MTTVKGFKKYKFIKVLFLVALLLVVTSCENNNAENTKIKELDYMNDNNEILNDSQKEVNENTKKDRLLLTTNNIDKYFNIKYNDFGEYSPEKIFYYDSKVLGYSLKFPLISFKGDVTFCFANNFENLTPSYIKVPKEYEIEALKNFGINKDMSLEDIKELDTTLGIKEYCTGESNYCRSYIELTIEDYVYALTTSSTDDEIWDIYIRKVGTNLIDVVYNDIINIISKYSAYSGVPIFYTRGNINNDSYEDIIITSEMVIDEDSDYDIDENRVTLILFGDKEGYIKYGEVKGLITSNGGLLGEPFISTSIDNGIISISQYGGSAWRWNFISTYKYDETDKKIYLISEENSNYHNVRPVQDTLQTITYKYENGSDILDGFVFRDNNEPEMVTKIFNKSKVTYQRLGNADNKEEIFINDIIRKYRNKLIKNIEREDFDGKFEIIVYSMIKNDKAMSICLTTKGYYYDSSEEIGDDKYNKYYHDEVYANIDLVNLKELDILDYYTIDEIAQTLYERHIEWGNIEGYSVKSKEDIISVIENSLNNSAEYNNKFGFCFNDLTIKVVLYLQYKDGNIVHERDSVLLRTDELVVNPIFYEEWFDSTLQ